MDKIKTVKIKNSDGSISEETYTISVDARNVDMDNERNLQDTIGDININRDGNIAEQLDNKINKIDIVDNLESPFSTKVLSAKQGKVLGDAVAALDTDIKKKVYFFNTVADMKAANLKSGDCVILLGYYILNDIKPKIYKIRELSENETNRGLYNIILSNNLLAECKNHNAINPYLCVNLWLDTNNLDRVKERINTYVTMGVTKLIIPLHMTGDNCILKENINFVKSAIDYALEQGLIVDTLKFHCTDSRIDSNSTYQNYYKTNVLSTINILKNIYNIKRVTILNERPAFYSRSANSNNVNFAINFVNDIKSLDLECSITISQINRIIEMINYNYTLANTLSFLCANDYPNAGYNGKNTTINDTLNAFNNYELSIKTIKNLMPTKKLFWSEVGVQDNYENYINPADWTFQNGFPSAKGNTIPIYFYGLVNFNGINDLDEVWLWYTEYFIDFKDKLEVFKNTEWGI